MKPSGLDDPTQEALEPGCRWFAEDLLGRALLAHDAFGEEADAARHLAGEPHLVGGEHHREPVFLEVADDVQHLGDELGIEGARDLVEQEHPRLHRERPHDGDALLLPTRQAIGILLRLLGEADALE